MRVQYSTIRPCYLPGVPLLSEETGIGVDKGGLRQRGWTETAKIQASIDMLREEGLEENMGWARLIKYGVGGSREVGVSCILENHEILCA